MRKSAGSFIALNREAFLLLGVMLSLAVFGIVALQSHAQSNTGIDKADTDSTAEMPNAPYPIGLWVLETPMVAHVQSPAATSDGTYGYVAGGFDNSTFSPSNVFERYNPLTNSWTLLAPLPTAVYGASAVYSPTNNKIYLFGGADSSFSPTNITQIYDVAGNTWALGISMRTTRENMALGYFNDIIYGVSGDDGIQVKRDFFEFNPSTNIFTYDRQPIPIGVSGAGFGVTTDGHLIVAGGKGAANTATKKVFDYDIAANTWTPKSDMPVAVDFPIGLLIREDRNLNRLLVMGGGNSNNPFAAGKTTQIYDPAMDTWSSGPDLNVGVYAPGGMVVGCNVFVVGGYDGTTTVGKTEGLSVNCSSVTVGGRVLTPDGRSLRNATVSLIDSNGVRRTTTTNSIGLYAFDDVRTGETYTLTAAQKRYRFTPRILPVNDTVNNVNFVGLE